MNVKGPQPPEPDQKPKWSYADFVTRIVALEGKVALLESQLTESRLSALQVRNAMLNLCDGLLVVQQSLLAALTSGGIPFTPQQKKVWEEVIARNDPKSVLHQNTNNLPH